MNRLSSYPPGCSGPPEESPICMVCGRNTEIHPEKGGCDCKECPECGEIGCIDHLSSDFLKAEKERLEIVTFNFRMELKKRYNKNPIFCKACGRKIEFEETDNEQFMGYHAECKEKQIEEIERM